MLLLCRRAWRAGVPATRTSAVLGHTSGSCRELPSTHIPIPCTYSWCHISCQMNRGMKQICSKSLLTAFWEQSFSLVRGLQPKVSTHSLPARIRAQRITYSLENCRPSEYQRHNTTRYNLQEMGCGATGSPSSREQGAGVP